MYNDPVHTPSNHDRLVERSRALHQLVAAKIRGYPTLLSIARQNLDRWIADQRTHGQVSQGLLDWELIFQTRTVAEILDLICDPSEEADRLRHSTPFCGILTEEERKIIFHDYAPLSA